MQSGSHVDLLRQIQSCGTLKPAKVIAAKAFVR